MDPIIQHIASGSPGSGGTATFYQDGERISWSLSDLDHAARGVARWLRDMGVSVGDRLGILSRNRLEWVLLDLAAIKLKAVTAGFEHGAFSPRTDLLGQYGLKCVFTDHPVDIPGFVDIRRVPRDTSPPGVEWPAPRYAADDVTTIKFTSGSTGTPKGLAATAGSIDSSISAVQKLFEHRPGDNLFVFLPLSLLQQRYWIYSALYYRHDVVVVNHELSLYAIKREGPTVIMGVPSFFDAMRAQIEAKAASLGGDAAARTRAATDLLGGRIRYLWTGSAPAKQETLRFFTECGTPIYEGYGMNETCIVSKNCPSAHRLGSVGRILDRKAVFLDEEGIIVVRSEYPVNRRYMFCREGESERIFMANGDVRTGDLGHIDEDEYLYIKGRADDLIPLGNGKNVFARPIEDMIKQHDAIGECVLFGAGRPHLVAVVSPSSPPLSRQVIASHIESINARLDARERVGTFIVAREPFSVDNGLLTSQYKPRRAKIENAYESEIARAYGESS